MFGYSSETWALCCIGMLAASLPAGAIDVSLDNLTPNSVLVGQGITWIANSSDEGTIRYRFRVRLLGEEYRMIRDYGPIAWLEWAADRDGLYEMEVSARNVETGDVSATSETIAIGGHVSDGPPVVNPTDHPLVFLFSAPACPSGSRMRVAFKAGDGPAHRTPYKDCSPDLSMDFYLAGLYAETAYSAQAELETEQSVTSSPPVEFQTGALSIEPWKTTILQKPPPGSTQPVLLSISAGNQIATDLEGNVIWYNPSPMTYATSLDAGGYFWGYLETHGRPVDEQGIRKVDLLGRTVLETNAERRVERLAQ